VGEEELVTVDELIGFLRQMPGDLPVVMPRPMTNDARPGLVYDVAAPYRIDCFRDDHGLRWWNQPGSPESVVALKHGPAPR
jgi:hypothetical protein